MANSSLCRPTDRPPTAAVGKNFLENAPHHRRRRRHLLFLHCCRRRPSASGPVSRIRQAEVETQKLVVAVVVRCSRKNEAAVETETEKKNRTRLNFHERTQQFLELEMFEQVKNCPGPRFIVWRNFPARLIPETGVQNYLRLSTSSQLAAPRLGSCRPFQPPASRYQAGLTKRDHRG